MAELVCFYLNNLDNIVVSGCCSDLKNIQKIYQLLHFNIVIIISTDISILKTILKPIEKNLSEKKYILFSPIHKTTLHKQIPFTQNIDVISKEMSINNLNLFINSLDELKKNPYSEKINPHTLLSKREKEILKMIFSGRNNKDIADSLFLSVKTIENHRNNILKKTGSKSMIALINSLFKLGFFINTHEN